MYELLSKLPESVAYTCTKCSDCHPAKWRTALEGELQGRLRHILTALLNSRTSAHLLHYRQVRNADWLFVDYTKKKPFAHVVTSPSGRNIIITFHTFFHFCAISGNAITNTTHFLSLFFFLVQLRSSHFSSTRNCSHALRKVHFLVRPWYISARLL